MKKTKTPFCRFSPCPICGAWFCRCRPASNKRMTTIERIMRLERQRASTSANRFPFKHFQAAKDTALKFKESCKNNDLPKGATQ